jgi:hypothetical protein
LSENFGVFLDNYRAIGYIDLVKVEFAAGGLTMAGRAEKALRGFAILMHSLRKGGI